MIKKPIYFLTGVALAGLLVGLVFWHWQLGLAVSFCLVFLWLSWLFPFAVFCGLAAYLPWQLALNLAPDFDILSGRLLVLLFFSSWLLKIILKKEKLGLVGFPAAGALGVFFVLAAGSLIGADQPFWGLRKLLVFVSVWPLFFLTKYFINSRARRDKLILTISVSSGAAALAALSQFGAQFLWGLEKTRIFLGEITAPYFFGRTAAESVLANPSWLVEIGGRVWLRALGVFPDPHTLAFFLGLSFCLVFAAAWERKKRAGWLLLPSGLLFSALLLTFSRGGYLGLGAALVFFGTAVWPKIKISGRLVFASGAVFLLAIIFFWGTPVLGRFQSIFDFGEGSNLGRLQIWRQSLEVAKQNPLLGVGLGNYPAALNFNENYRSAVSSHNAYLDILAETGVLGLSAWLFFWLVVLRAAWGKTRKAKEPAFFYAGIGSAIIYFLTHSFFETAIFNPTVAAWLAMISGLAVSRIKGED